MACPGSVRLARTVPTPPTTEYAREGTAAHALAELSLRRGVDPEMWLGLDVEGVTVTDDMVDFVRVYVEHVRALMARSSRHWIEYRFNLAALNPPGPMFGTADFVAYDAATRELHVVDLKYGQGVVVEARGNKQLRYYALGAALAFGAIDPIESVVATIVQPRAMHPDGVIRSETIPYVELVQYAAELMEAARATQAPDAPLVAGPHCRFCPAAGVCPAQRAAVEEAAMVAFEEMPLVQPRAPETLSDEEITKVMRLLPMLEDWAGAVRAHVQSRLERGEEFPGYKLVERRATRRWKNEQATRAWLDAMGESPDDYLDTKLKSPAQVEKLVGKKNLPADLVVKQSSGHTMVPAHDPRPAITSIAAHAFEALPPSTADDN